MPFLDDRQNRRYTQALEKAGICLRRAALYQDQLEWAKNQLVAFAASNTVHAAALADGGRQWKARLQAHRQTRNLNMAYSVFQPAFSGDRLVKLIVNLARQLDPLAAALISRQRATVAAAGAATSYRDLVAAVRAHNTPYPANANYDFVQLEAGPLPAPAIIPATIDSNIRLLAGHFINNIRNCCCRLFQRWADLNEAFSCHIPWMGQDADGNSKWPIFEKVEQLIPTGSDYHKGGQQVILVDMALVPGRPGPTNRRNKKHGYGYFCHAARNDQNPNTINRNEYGIERIVYKPADLEFDCRIVGDSAVVNLIQPSGYTQHSSLFEEINGILNLPVARQLPTYVILPYNPCSRLAPNWAAGAGVSVVNIRQSYGFIQFLTHNPEPEEDLHTQCLPSLQEFRNGAKKYKKPNWINESDYITDNTNHPVDFYFIWGQIMAIASTFCLSDLHRQNTIVHRGPYPRNSANYPPANSIPKPHPIDVEDGFKWPMSSLAMTGVPQSNLLVSLESENRLGVRDDKTLNVTVDWVPTPKELSKNQAFVYDATNNALYHEKPNYRTKRAMCEGFLAVMEALRQPAHNATLQTWVNGLTNTFTRFVIVATAEFYKQMLAYRTGFATVGPQLFFENTWYQSKEKRIRATRRDWTANSQRNLPRVQQVWTVNHPVFAIEHDAHNFFDYDNLDIPYYVRQLGRNELLNSRGHRINVGQSVADQTALWANHPNWDALAALDNNTGRSNAHGAAQTPAQLTHYFADSAVNFVNQQLQDLLAGPDPHYFDRVTRMLSEILRLRGLQCTGGEPNPAENIQGDTEDPETNLPNNRISLDGVIPPPRRQPLAAQNVRVPIYTYDYDGARPQRWIIRDQHDVVVYPAFFVFDEFMRLVREANPKFTQRRSSLNNLIGLINPPVATIQQVDTEVRTIPTDRREKYGDAIQYLWDRYEQGGVRLDTLPKWPESDYREFMRTVRVANTGFTQKRSSLDGLIRAINARDTGAQIQIARNQIPQPKRTQYQAALAHLSATYPGYPAVGDL